MNQIKLILECSFGHKPRVTETTPIRPVKSRPIQAADAIEAHINTKRKSKEKLSFLFLPLAV